MQPPVKKQKKTSRQKRKLLGGLLLFALVLAVVFVALLPKIRQKFPGKSSGANLLPPIRQQQLLHQEDAALLQTVTVRQTSGDSYELGCRDGALYLLDQGQWLDINDVYSDELLKAATYLMASDKVCDDAAEVEPYLSDMGLLPPRAEVTVTFTDGRQYVIELGAGVPETTYSYFRWSELPGIYMCDSSVSDAFLMSRNRLRHVEQPEIAAGLVDVIRIEKEQETLSIQLSTDTNGNTVGKILEPYCYPMDEAYAKSVSTALENFRLGTLEGAVDGQNMAQYGFDQPLAVVEIHQNGGTRMSTDENGALTTRTMEEQTLRFVFGKQEGDYFYTCLYEGNAYLVSRLLTEALVQGSSEEWTTMYPLRMSTSQLGSVVITTPTDEMQIYAQYTERVLENNELEVDQNGNLVYDIAVAVDGESWSSEGLDNLADRLYQIRISGKVPEGFSVEQKSPRWSMVITTVYGQTRKVEAYSMDAFSDALAVDGVICQYVHSEALQMALGELAQELTF